MPLAIVYAASEQDVLAVINYAHSADIAVAVRSGGHHYIGASSTNVTGRAVPTWDPPTCRSADPTRARLVLALIRPVCSPCALSGPQRSAGHERRGVPLGRQLHRARWRDAGDRRPGRGASAARPVHSGGHEP